MLLAVIIQDELREFLQRGGNDQVQTVRGNESLVITAEYFIIISFRGQKDVCKNNDAYVIRSFFQIFSRNVIQVCNFVRE